VVVVLAEEVQMAIDTSQAREDKEAKTREQLKAGKTTVELIGLQKLLDQFGMK
jgi:regulator of RNase E activity RraA